VQPLPIRRAHLRLLGLGQVTGARMRLCIRFEALKALDPDSFQLHALMGEVYADQERYSDAIEEYQKAVAKRPDAPGMQFLIGVAYWAQRQMEPAEKAFKEAYKENPNDPMTNLYLGDIAVRYQHFSDAMPYLMATKANAGRTAPTAHFAGAMLSSAKRAAEGEGRVSSGDYRRPRRGATTLFAGESLP